jgi:hypothetical protein
LNDQWVIEEIRRKIKNIPEIYENEKISFQSLWATARAVLRGKFIASSTCI